MGMTLKDLCVLSPALTGDYESSIALLQDDAECAKILADLEKSKRDMTRTSYEVNPKRSPWPWRWELARPTCGRVINVR